MRNVTLVIAKLGLSVGDSIKLQLVDKLGNVVNSMSEFSIDEDIVLTSDTFSINLLENEHTHIMSLYKLTLPNNLEFTFKLPLSNENIPHDLLSLLKMSCFGGIVYEVGNKIALDSAFIIKLELYFMGEKAYFTNTQRDLILLYEYYADEIINSTSTIDIVKLMDEYLAKLGVK